LSERDRLRDVFVVLGVRRLVCPVEAEPKVGVDAREVKLPFPTGWYSCPGPGP